MKNIFKAVAVGVVLMFLAGCATTTSDGTTKPHGKKYKVGVILPLSGHFSLYGESTLHGIQCAAGLVTPCVSPLNIELVVKDSSGSPSKTEQAVEELAKENVVAIVGPLLSSTVDAAAKKAEEMKIPLVSLSQKEGVVDAGKYVFKHALSAQDQVDTLVNYAVEKRKLKRFAILYPSNSYGAQFAQMFRSKVEGSGGKIVYKKSYSHEALKNVDAAKEGGFTSFDGGGTQQNQTPANEFDMPADTQAVFIPDSYKAVDFVLNLLQKEHKDLPANVVFMGINRWNNPGLVSRDIGLLEGSIFVDGFYKDSADTATKQFVQDFINAFGIDPTILEAQAFDSMKIVIAGIRNGGTNREKLTSAIGKTKNLEGATGSITIDKEGESHRNLFILTVRNGAIAELSSAKGAKGGGIGFTYSSDSKATSDAKYKGGQVPDLSSRSDLPKYAPPALDDIEAP